MDPNSNKIQYLTICSSVSLGGKSLYSKREEEDNTNIKKDTTQWKLTGSEYDAFKLTDGITKDVFPNFTQKGQLEFKSTAFELTTRSKVENDLKNFFNNNDFDASLLIISGQGGQNTNKGVKESYFVIITNKGDEHIS